MGIADKLQDLGIDALSRFSLQKISDQLPNEVGAQAKFLCQKILQFFMLSVDDSVVTYKVEQSTYSWKAWMILDESGRGKNSS